jgi:hypothetical protein
VPPAELVSRVPPTSQLVVVQETPARPAAVPCLARPGSSIAPCHVFPVALATKNSAAPLLAT